MTGVFAHKVAIGEAMANLSSDYLPNWVNIGDNMGAIADFTQPISFPFASFLDYLF
jgi:hypothetical protein